MMLTFLLSLLFAAAGLAASPKLNYPVAQRDAVVDDYHGTKVADPYRWLEDLESPRTMEWVKGEGELTVDYLGKLPGRDGIRARLTELWDYSRTGTPWREGGKVYFEENSGLQQQSVLYVQDSPGAEPRVILDPQQISPDGSTEVGSFAVSPDGRFVAYRVSEGGSDIGDTRVRDVITGTDRGDVVHGTFTSVCWTSGGGFFYFTRPRASDAGTIATGARLDKQAWYHALGTPTERDVLIHDWKEARWLYAIMSDDGQRAILVEEGGAGSRMNLIDLGNAITPNVSAPMVPLLAGSEASYTPMGTVDNILYVFTDLYAPHGRIIALDLNDGAGAKAREVVPEQDDVLQGATVAGDRLVVHYLHNVTSRVVIFTLEGKARGRIALPGMGAVGWALNGRHSEREVWYSFTSFLSPETVYRYDFTDGSNTAFRAPRLPFDPSAYETKQVFYSSRGGTRVPMFVTARKSLALNGANPVFLTAYGGYGSIMSPDYRADLPLWLERGGVYAVANIRGGGEYGEDWHRAGSLEKKQTSFDDFIAAAEYLIKERYTSKEKLAIYGHSNGGLLIGAMITQRPDLFAAAIANAGHHDMLRYHTFTVGGGWIPEYGSSDNAADFRWLFAYSPLHNVRDATCYPATMLLTGDHDDRVVPGHSYKFAAALQAAQSCDKPILLRVASDASHSYASGTGAIAEKADIWAFVASRTGVGGP